MRRGARRRPAVRRVRLYLGVVNEQHAEQLFVLADRLTDVRLQLACSQQLVAVRADVSAWWQLAIVAGAAAAGVL